MKYIVIICFSVVGYAIGRLISDSFFVGWFSGIIVGTINSIILEEDEEE